MNVFYAGIDNPITIAADNYSCKDLLVEISNGSIYKHEYMHGRYVVNVSTPSIVKIIIKNKKGKLLGEVTFRVKKIPDPVAKIGDMNGGLVIKNKFKVHRGLLADLENFDFDLRFRVISFDVIVIN